MVIADALERAKSTKPEDVKEALKKTYLKQDLMVGGAVTFDAKGDNVNADTAMVQVIGGNVKVVLPKRVAEVPYVFPIPKQLWERGM
jgi:branched-chain amino acid transport system substrate-binding protein